MNYDEYAHDGHVLYETFAQTVASIIEAAIADSGQNFRVQQISCRAKSNTSLHRKLTERNLFESPAIEADLRTSPAAALSSIRTPILTDT